MIRQIFIVTCLVLVSATRLAAPNDSTLARTERGPVRGLAVNGVVAFKGIPFAAPPVGAAPGDSLFLNVWRPFDTSAGANLPVLVWMHGGFVGGGTPAYDGSAFARQEIVFVSANYRFARPGFFATPALLAANQGLVGDFAYEDQVMALQWVRRNIGAFGGDARRITIIGDLAGGASVLRHLVSPGSLGLFQQTIVMSGGSSRGPLTLPLEEFFRAGTMANVPVIIGADMTRDEPARLVARTVTARGQRAWRYRIAYGAESTQVALAFNAYVTNFVKDGDPNGGGLPGWRAHEPSRQRLMVFAPEGPQYGPDPRAVALVKRAADAWAAAWH